MGPRGISVQFVVDLYRGDHLVAATKHTVKMCIYSSIDYVLDFNFYISVSSYFSRIALSLETENFIQFARNSSFCLHIPRAKTICRRKDEFLAI